MTTYRLRLREDVDQGHVKKQLYASFPTTLAKEGFVFRYNPRNDGTHDISLSKTGLDAEAIKAEISRLFSPAFIIPEELDSVEVKEFA